MPASLRSPAGLPRLRGDECLWFFRVLGMFVEQPVDSTSGVFDRRAAVVAEAVFERVVRSSDGWWNACDERGPGRELGPIKASPADDAGAGVRVDCAPAIEIGAIEHDLVVDLPRRYQVGAAFQHHWDWLVKERVLVA